MDAQLTRQQVKLSKFLSLILRHDPGSIGVQLDAQGWVAIDELLQKAAAAGQPIVRAELDKVIAQNDKQRFSVSADGLRLRAAQGHSVRVELGLSPSQPPAQLYHGTATRFLAAILAEGLRPQSRQQVHLSADLDTALTVGRRHGAPVVLNVDAASMQARGHVFFQADNGVWLTDAVPAEFLQVATP